MNENEFRDKQKEWDEKYLDKKISRWKQLTPASYNVTLPNLAWYYITEADDMYIAGYFLGVILLCSGIAELTLADQITAKGKITSKEIQRFNFEHLIIIGHRLGILDDTEANHLNDLRKIRNNIIHAKVGELTKLARKQYSVLGLGIDDDDPGLYLKPIFGHGADEDALRNLTLIKNLTVKFYGAEP